MPADAPTTRPGEWTDAVAPEARPGNPTRALAALLLARAHRILAKANTNGTNSGAKDTAADLCQGVD